MSDSIFSSYCPNGNAAEAYKHDITDSMGGETNRDRFLYCKQCGQAVSVMEALERTAYLRSEAPAS